MESQVKLMCTNFCMEQNQDPDIITVIEKQCLKQQRKGMHKNTLADNFSTAINRASTSRLQTEEKNYMSEQQQG